MSKENVKKGAKIWQWSADKLKMKDVTIILFQQTKILPKRTEEIQHVNKYRKMYYDNVPREKCQRITIEGQELEEVTRFITLGRVIEESGIIEKKLDKLEDSIYNTL